MSLVLALAAISVSCVSGDTDPATSVSDRAATLRGHGSPGGDPAQWWFKYGKTTAYGSTTPKRNVGSGTGQQSVSERVTGLENSTLYHYQICASGSGSGCGKDLTLKTGANGLLPGFQETTAFSGLEAPTAVRFALDGRIYVAREAGAIKVYDSLSPTPLRQWSSTSASTSTISGIAGCWGMALHPNFPTVPYVYVLYTFDAVPSAASAPRWGGDT